MRGQLHDRFIERVFLVLCAAGQRWMEIDDYVMGMALLNKGSYEDKLKRTSALAVLRGREPRPVVLVPFARVCVFGVSLFYHLS